MFIRRVGLCVALILVATANTACASAADSEAMDAGRSVTDSAGVRVVMHSLKNAALDAVPAWSVTGSPDWTGDTTFFVRALVGSLAERHALFELVHEASRDADGAIKSNTQLASLDWSGQWQLIGPSRAAPSLTRRPPGPDGALGAGMSPLAPRTIDVVCGNGIVTSDTHELTLGQSSTTGELELSIRTDLQPRGASEQDFAREMGRPFTAEQMQSPEMQLAVQQMRKQFADAKAPLVSEVQCDEQSNIYAVLAETPTQIEHRVIVFGTNGSLRGQFALPADWSLLAFQSNRLAVLRRDTNDLESVSVFRVQPFARD